MSHSGDRRSWAVCAAALLLTGCAARMLKPTSDGVRVLTETIAAMRSEALGRERVDWDSLERRLLQDLPERATPREAEPFIREAVAALGDPHARYEPALTITTSDAPVAEEPVAHAPAPARPPIPALPVGEMLDGSIAYILVPLCGTTSGEEPLAYVRAGWAVIGSLSERSPHGWIIDLRLNGGGNVWPMLLALSPLLGDGAHMTSIVDGRVTARFGTSGREAWLDSGSGRQVQIAMPEGEQAPASIPGAKIAVLLGPWTMSSGESLAIALRSLPGARTFGEPTAGLTTVTQTYTLSDGSRLFLPVSVMGDRAGRGFPAGLRPDEPVPFKDWPARDDAVTKAAGGWIHSLR